MISLRQRSLIVFSYALISLCSYQSSSAQIETNQLAGQADNNTSVTPLHQIVKKVTVTQDPADPTRTVYLFCKEHELAPDIKELFDGWNPQDVKMILRHVYKKVDSPEAVEEALRKCTLNKGTFLLMILEASDTNINEQSYDGSTPLIRAAVIGEASIVEELIKQPTIAINTVDNNGCTALMYAAALGHEDCVKFLLSAQDCAITLKNNNGVSALDLAEMNEQKETVRLLQDAQKA